MVSSFWYRRSGPLTTSDKYATDYAALDTREKALWHTMAA
jgi:hypothetical protein